jgi:hypothetical protein
MPITGGSGGGSDPLGTLVNPFPLEGSYYYNAAGVLIRAYFNSDNILVTEVVGGTDVYYASLWGLFANINT